MRTCKRAIVFPGDINFLELSYDNEWVIDQRFELSCEQNAMAINENQTKNRRLRKPGEPINENVPTNAKKESSRPQLDRVNIKS